MLSRSIYSKKKYSDSIWLRLFREKFVYSDGRLLHRKNKKFADTYIKKANKDTDLQTGYRKTLVDNVVFSSHQIIFVLHYGYFPECIDHIDGNSLNNSIENLRPCSQDENKKHRKLNRNSSTGVKGVFFHKASGKYAASVAGKHLGLFHTVDTASEAYKKEAKKIFGEFF